MPALVLAEEFRDFLESKRLTQKYWRDFFGEFILDHLWEDLTNAGVEQQGGAE